MNQDIWIPMSDEKERLPPVSVLYVDDEEGLLTLGKFFLERTGDFRVDTLTSATAALSSSCIEAYDVIVSDYQMPVMDGIEFLKEISTLGTKKFTRNIFRHAAL